MTLKVDIVNKVNQSTVMFSSLQVGEIFQFDTSEDFVMRPLIGIKVAGQVVGNYSWMCLDGNEPIGQIFNCSRDLRVFPKKGKAVITIEY